MEPNFDMEPLKMLGTKVTAGLIMIAVGLVLFVVLILATAWGAAVAFGAPIAEAGDARVTITLFDEACAIAAVSNLPQRATWTEGGKIFDGCWASAGGIILLYFSDRSVVAVPTQVFQRVTGV